MEKRKPLIINLILVFILSFTFSNCTLAPCLSDSDFDYVTENPNPEFEFADTPMSVIHGKINFDNVESPYELFRNHCKIFKVQINDDEPNHRFIDTVVIPELKVYLDKGTELKGWGGAITGMDNEEYEIQFGGITAELMQTEFKHHYDEYFGTE